MVAAEMGALSNMGSVSIPGPGVFIKPPQQPDSPIDSMGRLVQMKSMMQQQQLQQQQIVGAQQENQQRALQLKDQQTLRQISSDPSIDWTKPDSFNTLLSKAAQSGVSPVTLNTLRTSNMEYLQKFTSMQKDQQDMHIKALDAISGDLNGIVSMQDPQQKQAAWQKKVTAYEQSGELQPGKVPEQYPGDDQARSMLSQLQLMSAQSKQAQENAGAQKDVALAGEAQAATAEKKATAEWYKNNPGAGAPGVPPTAAQMGSWLRNNPGKTPDQYPAAQAAAEAQATQPYKLQEALAVEQAKHALEGIDQPVYALDTNPASPTYNRKKLMNRTAAQAAGMPITMPVTSNEVQGDTVALNRLGDVHNKITAYEQAMQKDLSTNGMFSQKDTTTMAQILGDDKFKLGAFGVELPVDWLNKLGQKGLAEKLSPAAQDRLVGYYNAREAMNGYNRVLSGSSKGSDKSMELNLDTLPQPITPTDFSNKLTTAFKQNLKIVGQGFPIIPGVKRPEEWEQGPSGSAGAGSSSGWGAQFGGVPHQ